MSKALSLKKPNKASQSKKQKPITQYFKNNSHLEKYSDDSTQSCKYNGEVDVQSAKRKASSPIFQSTADLGKITDDPYLINNTNKQNSHNGLIFMSSCTNKKLKIETSPEKHKDMLRNSPKKENKLQLSSDEKMDNTLVSSKTEDKLCEKAKQDRSPLTPIKFENNIICNSNVISKSCTEDGKNYENSLNKASTYEDSVFISTTDVESPKIKPRTPRKSPIIGSTAQYSPGVEKLLITETVSAKKLSPSKCGSTVRILNFNDHDIQDVFGDEWKIIDNDEICADELDLSTMQHCEVVSLKHHPDRLEIRLKDATNKRATCFIEGSWLDTPLCLGEIVSIIATRNLTNEFHINNTSGLLVLRPDHLISSTNVVAGVFCKRKAILQERWRGIDSANTAMTIGILIHELVQTAFTQQITDVKILQLQASRIIKESIQRLYDACLSEEEALSNMQIYLTPLAEFMQTYVGRNSVFSTPQHLQKDKWNGHIDKVLDIEENLCCPELGLKGKIDATLQVTIHDRKGAKREIVPLELKSGKASVSAEHRGQLVLYGMMLSLQQREDPTRALQRGLLLYLKDRVELREVSCGYPERRDLVMLRNQLVENLAASPHDVDPEQLTDIEEASLLLQQKLPDPIHHEGACSKCPYLTICSLHLWHTNGPSVSDKHPLSKLHEQALGHLTAEHIKYFLHWTALLKMEEKLQMTTSPLHTLWTDSPENRAKRGTCAPNLQLKSVKAFEDRFLHIFERNIIIKGENKEEKHVKGPQEGDFSIVSIENRPWIAAGAVTISNETEMQILLERDLSRRLNKTTLFHIDTYESYASVVNNLSNLGVLMDNDDRAQRLRKLIIDKEEPQFEKKLPREVGRLGTKLMRSLNIQQQRAVLKALAATDYALLQGLPGTGKTQTISVLIQMLVALKQRVLVTAHTHSAVDTVLNRLPEQMKVMRLGPEARVAAQQVSRCEHRLAAHCRTPKQLEELYNSMEVVGVTCLGAAHAMLSRTTFDVCIVDEATQVVQCTVLRPLFAAKRFVLVGDPEQLPPVVRSRAARRLGMEESLFHRLMKEEVTSTLQLQYRMNEAIVNIANKVAYNDRLKCANERIAQANLSIDVQKISVMPEWVVEACSTRAERAVVFLDLPPPAAAVPTDTPCLNRDEACVVLALVNAMIEGGVQPADIGVIAPYREQVALLRRSLTRYTVEASTVDQFQGRDKDVIIYSCTRRDMRQDDSKIKENEILNDRRRLAVSVTRAKYKLMVVGNARALRRYAPLRQLIEACAKIPLAEDTLAAVVHKYETHVS
ncbi:DNA replication ATP-dependent helicase/nuclease DNA2 isoform X2 [Galleria mellonella]|uniref:DNA replication ATP-dependent helicase/nuclease n=1 Tax=Galleria mellonella TaxID=7137 RepID=A0A6J3C075_GALME|nr:DNA replication ATP-dependent helicase/nuclease DNA2 isoform X2 [Galleria mellonella]